MRAPKELSSIVIVATLAFGCVCLVVAAVPARTASSNRPRLFEEPIVLAPALPFDAHDFEHEFRNDSNATLEFLSVQPSCACATVDFVPLRVEIGGKFKVRGTINGRTLVGPFTVQLVTTIANPDRKIKTIQLQGEILSPISIELDSEYSKESFKLLLRNTSDKNYVLKLKKVAPQIVEPVASVWYVSAGASEQIDIPKPVSPLNEGLMTLQFLCHDAESGEGESLHQSQRLPLAVSGIRLFPESIDFGVVSERRAFSIDVTSLTTQQALRVSKIEAPEGVILEDVKVGSAISQQFRIVLTPERKSGDLNGLVVISLDDPTGSTPPGNIYLPISAFVLR